MTHVHFCYLLLLGVQENYPGVRAQYPELQSKEIIGLVARQWASISDMEKQAWKQRAIATTVVSEEGLDEEHEQEQSDDEQPSSESESEADDDQEEEEDAKKKRAKKK